MSKCDVNRVVPYRARVSRIPNGGSLVTFSNGASSNPGRATERGLDKARQVREETDETLTVPDVVEDRLGPKFPFHVIPFDPIFFDLPAHPPAVKSEAS